MTTVSSPPEQEQEDIGLSSFIIGEYSLPTLAEMTSESLLTQSQYAKVIFHDLLPCYPTDADIWCRYSVTDGVKVRHGDRIALYCVGWSSVHDHVQFEMAPVPNKQMKPEDMKFEVLFRAEHLPKDTSEFYQLCYVNVDSTVCGASVPFQFRQVIDDELCEIEEEEGLLVVRSKTAINEDKLRDAMHLIDELEKKNCDHERKVIELGESRDKLLQRLEELSDIQKHEQRLQKDIQSLDLEKNEAFIKLQKVEHHVEQLTSTIEALNTEKTSLNQLLKTESQKKLIENVELSRLRIQLDNMQQMLDASTQSKEMASQALHCEQSKVMKLNIEHDKYKYRSQHLEEENTVLKVDLEKWRNMSAALKKQVEQNLGLIHLKSKENDELASKCQDLLREINVLKTEIDRLETALQEARFTNEDKEIHLKHCSSQMSLFEEKSKNFGQAILENVELKRQLLEENEKVKKLQEKNSILHEQFEQVVGENTTVHLLENENKTLRLENATLHQCKIELQKLKHENGLLNSQLSEATATSSTKSTIEKLKIDNMTLSTQLDTLCAQNNSSLIELRELNDSLQSQLLSVKSSDEPLAQLQQQLSHAEVSNQLLLAELQQIKSQPDRNVSQRQEDSNSSRARTQETNNGVDLSLTIKIMELQNEKANKEIQLEETKSREASTKDLLDSMVKRLKEIDEEIAFARSELDVLHPRSKSDSDDLVQINQRMETVQEQILRDDEREGMSRETEDQERLERMSKRSHDLHCKITETASLIYDIEQNMLVLEQEKISLQKKVEEMPQVAKELSEVKCKILEELVNLDRKVISLREELFKKKEEDLENVKLKCLNIAMGIGQIPESAISFEINSTDLERSSMERSGNSLRCVSGLTEERIERAVADGVREGLKHGLDNLKQVAQESMSVESLDGISNESLQQAEWEIVHVEQKCAEKEEVLKEKLTDVLEKTVRQGLLESFHEGLNSVPSENVAVESSKWEKELQLRLELAAEEYRKVYVQKLKVEKRLAKLQQRQSFSPRLEPTLEKTVAPVQGFVCPICNVTFPLSGSDLFTRHFEDHLS